MSDIHRPLLRFRLLFAVLAVAVVGTTFAQPVDDNPPVGWWHDATFYEIFVRSFADSTKGPLANDGIGDLQGLIDHLDYLNDGRGADSHSLGINAVWLMPIQPSPSYHGYDVIDYFAVNPQYGDVALMKKFVAAAHRHGIRVIIDLVLNHASSEHPLFRQALASTDDQKDPRALFRFAPTPEQLYGPWGTRVWHPAGKEFYYGLFSPEMPDWNFRNPVVTAHHRRCAEFWLKDVGVDGFRLDAVRYFFEDGDTPVDAPETLRWLHDFTAYCHQIKPGSFVVGEVAADTDTISRYIHGSLDSAFEFDLARAVIESVRLKTPGVLELVTNRLARRYGADHPWSSFLSNHDQDRVLSQLDGNPAQMRFAAKLLFTLPGVPFVYYGEELGMTGTKPDPEIRTPMPWSATEPNAGFTGATVRPWHAVTGQIRTTNVADEEQDPHSLLALYQHLIRMNRDSAALRHGTSVPVSVRDRRVYAAMRQTGNEAVLVLANFSTTARACPELNVAQSEVRAGWAREELVTGAPIAPPALTAAGGFGAWRPFATLAPESVYVIRWMGTR